MFAATREIPKRQSRTAAAETAEEASKINEVQVKGGAQHAW
jgi:hypothetical protein